MQKKKHSKQKRTTRVVVKTKTQAAASKCQQALGLRAKSPPRGAETHAEFSRPRSQASHGLTRPCASADELEAQRRLSQRQACGKHARTPGSSKSAPGGGAAGAVTVVATSAGASFESGQRCSASSLSHEVGSDADGCVVANSQCSMPPASGNKEDFSWRLLELDKTRHRDAAQAGQHRCKPSAGCGFIRWPLIAAAATAAATAVAAILVARCGVGGRAAGARPRRARRQHITNFRCWRKQRPHLSPADQSIPRGRCVRVDVHSKACSGGADQ